MKMFYKIKNKIQNHKYFLILPLILLFVIAGGFSFTYFSNSIESRGSLNIITGELYSVIESEGLDESHSIIINNGETKYITIILKNTNKVDARFDLYYESEEGVSVSYDTKNDGYMYATCSFRLVLTTT